METTQEDQVLPHPLGNEEHAALERTLARAVVDGAAAQLAILPALVTLLDRWDALTSDVRAGLVPPSELDGQRQSLLGVSAWDIIRILVRAPLPHGGRLHLCADPPQPGSPPPRVFSGGYETTEAVLHFVAQHTNPASGVDHPADQKRWERFVIAAHQDVYPLSGADLALWLIHVHSWPEDSARDLGLLYDKERSALEHYDHIREGDEE